MSDEAKMYTTTKRHFGNFLMPITICNYCKHARMGVVSFVVSTCCGGNGFNAFDNVVYNLNEEDSKAFALGLKFGMKPFSALVHSGVDAHNKLLGGRSDAYACKRRCKAVATCLKLNEMLSEIG